MNEITLPSRHGIRNSNPGGMWYMIFASGWGRNIFVSFKPPRPGNEPRTLCLKGSGANHNPRPPALVIMYRPTVADPA